MTRLSSRNWRKSGFSLIEAFVSTFIFLAFLAAVYGAISSSREYTDVQSTYAKMRMDAHRALDAMAFELRMSGWRDNPDPNEPDFPYVFTNGVAEGYYADESHDPPAQHIPATSPAFGDIREIVFKIPFDADADSFPTDGDTGLPEWSDFDVSYVLVTDAGGVNTLLRRQNGVMTDIIARFVERVTFNTYKTDAAVGINEIAITIYMARPVPTGAWLETNLSTVVTMRNIEEPE